MQPKLLKRINLLETKEELLNFVASYLNLLDPINLVTCIYRLAKIYCAIRSPSSKHQWKSELFNSSNFGLLLLTIQSSVLKVVHSPPVAQPPPVRGLDSRCLSNLVWAVVKLELALDRGTLGERIIHSVSPLVLRMLNTSSPQSLANLLWAYAKLPIPPEEVMVSILSHMTHLLNSILDPSSDGTNNKTDLTIRDDWDHHPRRQASRRNPIERGNANGTANKALHNVNFNGNANSTETVLKSSQNNSASSNNNNNNPSSHNNAGVMIFDAQALSNSVWAVAHSRSKLVALKATNAPTATTVAAAAPDIAFSASVSVTSGAYSTGSFSASASASTASIGAVESGGLVSSSSSSIIGAPPTLSTSDRISEGGVGVANAIIDDKVSSDDGDKGGKEKRSGDLCSCPGITVNNVNGLGKDRITSNENASKTTMIHVTLLGQKDSDNGLDDATNKDNNRHDCGDEFVLLGAAKDLTSDDNIKRNNIDGLNSSSSFQIGDLCDRARIISIGSEGGGGDEGVTANNRQYGRTGEGIGLEGGEGKEEKEKKEEEYESNGEESAFLKGMKTKRTNAEGHANDKSEMLKPSLIVGPFLISELADKHQDAIIPSNSISCPSPSDLSSLLISTTSSSSSSLFSSPSVLTTTTTTTITNTTAAAAAVIVPSHSMVEVETLDFDDHGMTSCSRRGGDSERLRVESASQDPVHCVVSSSSPFIVTMEGAVGGASIKDGVDINNRSVDDDVVIINNNSSKDGFVDNDRKNCANAGRSVNEDSVTSNPETDVFSMATSGGGTGVISSSTAGTRTCTTTCTTTALTSSSTAFSPQDPVTIPFLTALARLASRMLRSLGPGTGNDEGFWAKGGLGGEGGRGSGLGAHHSPQNSFSNHNGALYQNSMNHHLHIHPMDNAPFQPHPHQQSSSHSYYNHHQQQHYSNHQNQNLNHHPQQPHNHHHPYHNPIPQQHPNFSPLSRPSLSLEAVLADLKLSERLFHNLESRFSCQSLVNIVWSFASLLDEQCRDHPAITILFQASRSEAITRLRIAHDALMAGLAWVHSVAGFNEQALSNVVYAYEKAGVLDRELLAWVFRVAALRLSRAKDSSNGPAFKPQELCTLLRAVHVPIAETTFFLESLIATLQHVPWMLRTWSQSEIQELGRALGLMGISVASLVPSMFLSGLPGAGIAGGGVGGVGGCGEKEGEGDGERKGVERERKGVERERKGVERERERKRTNGASMGGGKEINVMMSNPGMMNFSSAPLVTSAASPATSTPLGIGSSPLAVARTNATANTTSISHPSVINPCASTTPSGIYSPAAAFMRSMQPAVLWNGGSYPLYNTNDLMGGGERSESGGHFMSPANRNGANAVLNMPGVGGSVIDLGSDRSPEVLGATNLLGSCQQNAGSSNGHGNVSNNSSNNTPNFFVEMKRQNHYEQPQKPYPLQQNQIHHFQQSFQGGGGGGGGGRRMSAQHQQQDMQVTPSFASYSFHQQQSHQQQQQQHAFGCYPKEEYSMAASIASSTNRPYYPHHLSQQEQLQQLQQQQQMLQHIKQHLDHFTIENAAGSVMYGTLPTSSATPSPSSTPPLHLPTAMSGTLPSHPPSSPTILAISSPPASFGNATFSLNFPPISTSTASDARAASSPLSSAIYPSVNMVGSLRDHALEMPSMRALPFSLESFSSSSSSLYPFESLESSSDTGTIHSSHSPFSVMTPTSNSITGINMISNNTNNANNSNNSNNINKNRSNSGDANNHGGMNSSISNNIFVNNSSGDIGNSDKTATTTTINANNSNSNLSASSPFKLSERRVEGALGGGLGYGPLGIQHLQQSQQQQPPYLREEDDALIMKHWEQRTQHLTDRLSQLQQQSQQLNQQMLNQQLFASTTSSSPSSMAASATAMANGGFGTGWS